ncbi:hypothetical protein BASA61_008947 [Batrachochytrium salamandrivorans]|nr:hypothetical protein BASA61_008947 [Batrachochytrium salamandrivorans]
MRLISFAVISLLAITVSAQPPPNTFAADDAPQCDKDVIMHKIRELATAHKAQQELIKTLEEPGKAEQEEQIIKSVMKEIEEQLKRTDLLEGERPGLEKHYTGSVNDLEKAQNALVAKQDELKEARNQHYGIWIKINILEENLALKEEQDVKDKSKTGASSSSSPHRDILQKQIDEDCPNSVGLFAAYSDIKEGISKLDDMIKRTKNPKKKLELSKTRNKVAKAFNKLPREKLLSTSIAHLVVECEQVTGHRIQSGLVPAIQKSRLRLLGRALDSGVENVYTWLRGRVINGEADLDQLLVGRDCGAMDLLGTRHDNRALAARLADFLQVVYHAVSLQELVKLTSSTASLCLDEAWLTVFHGSDLTFRFTKHL